MVSVVIPFYNAHETLPETLRSLEAQSYKNYELIIVDDCSDVPLENASARNPRNMGAGYSRNLGVALAAGEYVALLDADDVWDAHKLELQRAFMRERDAQISYTASSFFNSSYVLRAQEELNYQTLLKRNLMSCSSVMARRELLLRFPFPEGRLIHEDYAAWLRILRETGIAYGLDLPLLKYRLSAKSKSAGRLRSAVMTYNAYRAVGYKQVAAAALTARYALHSVSKRARLR